MYSLGIDSVFVVSPRDIGGLILMIIFTIIIAVVTFIDWIRKDA